MEVTWHDWMEKNHSHSNNVFLFSTQKRGTKSTITRLEFSLERMEGMNDNDHTYFV